STFLDDAVYADLHAGRKEISSYTNYNYRYAEQSKLQVDYSVNMAYHTLLKLLHKNSLRINSVVWKPSSWDYGAFK
ncbi:hypothetical protein Tco_1008993, partial [Tanacetum coccineum]